MATQSFRTLNLTLLLCTSMVSVLACGDSDEPTNMNPVPDSGAMDTKAPDADVGRLDTGAADTNVPDTTTEVGADTQTNGPDTAETSAAKALVRVAHFSSSAPTVQLCVKPAGSTFGASDMPIGTLAYKAVTNYLSLEPGSYSVRLVGESATNCATGAFDLPAPLAVAAGKAYTAMAVGKFGTTTGPEAFGVTALEDLQAEPAGGKMHLRFVHGAVQTNIPVFVGVAASDATKLGTPVFSDVPYKGIDPSKASTLGFQPLDAPLSAVLGAAATADGALVWRQRGLSAAPLPQGAIVSVFAVDEKVGAPAGDVTVIVCDDKKAKTTAPACSELSTDLVAALRVGHFSANAPAVKVCASRGAFTDQDLPVTPALAFKTVTGYLQVRPGTYNVRLVGESATNCGTGAFDVTGLALAGDEHYTAFASGEFGATTGATAFGVTALADLAAEPASGKMHLRFVHAAKSTNIGVYVGAVGTASGTTLSTPVFSDVAYKGTDATKSATRGFAPLDAPFGAVLGASPSANGALVWRNGALAGEGAALPAGSIWSVFAVDRTASSTAGQVTVIACDDKKAASDPSSTGLCLELASNL